MESHLLSQTSIFDDYAEKALGAFPSYPSRQGQLQWSQELPAITTVNRFEDSWYKNEGTLFSEVFFDHVTFDSSFLAEFGNTAVENQSETHKSSTDDLSDESIIRLLESFEVSSFEQTEDAGYESFSPTNINPDLKYSVEESFTSKSGKTDVMVRQFESMLTSNPQTQEKQQTIVSQSAQTSPNSPDKSETKKMRTRKRERRSVYLWEFLVQLLLDSSYTNCIRWISQAEGIFCIVNSSALAKLWGKRKRRENMTYEKMSRAMRYYYSRKILERVPKQKLYIYKFSARILKEINKGVWSKAIL